MPPSPMQAFDSADVEGRAWMLGNGLLMIWLTLSALMMLNLLIAMFSSTCDCYVIAV